MEVECIYLPKGSSFLPRRMLAQVCVGAHCLTLPPPKYDSKNGLYKEMQGAIGMFNFWRNLLGEHGRSPVPCFLQVQAFSCAPAFQEMKDSSVQGGNPTGGVGTLTGYFQKKRSPYLPASIL